MQTETKLTREIPRSEWVEFLDRFSEQHAGWLVTLQVLDRNLGAQILAENVPLRGISADLKDKEDMISINVGETSRNHVDHIISNPTHMILKLNAQGAHEALELETPEGTTTLLSFRVSAMPETVDGVMSAPT